MGLSDEALHLSFFCKHLKQLRITKGLVHPGRGCEGESTSCFSSSKATTILHRKFGYKKNNNCCVFHRPQIEAQAVKRWDFLLLIMDFKKANCNFRQNY